MRSQDEPLPHEDFDVEDTIVHPSYNPANFRNDVGLVRLAKDVVFKEHIIPVCLPQYRQNFVGKYARVIGWGRTEHGKSSRVLGIHSSFFPNFNFPPNQKSPFSKNH